MKRFDKGYFYYSLIYSVFVSAVISLGAYANLIPEDATELDAVATLLLLIAAAVVFAVAYIAMVVRAYLYVKTSGYELTQNEIKVKHGVIFKKSSVLSYTKMHAVNKKQNLLHRLFNIAVLTVDSGATTKALAAEITIIEKADTVEELIRKLKAAQQGEDISIEATQSVIPNKAEKKNLYNFNSKLKIIYSALTVAASLFFCLVLIAITVIAFFASAFVLSRVANEFSIIDNAVVLGIIAALALLIITVISSIGGIISSFVAYHDFKIFRDKNGIEISYGLLSKQTNTFSLDKIKGIKIKEDPVKRLFGYVEVGLEVVGYGNGDGSESEQKNTAPGMLMPLCKKSELGELLSSILPEFQVSLAQSRSKSYPAFVLWPCLIISAVFALTLLLTAWAMLIAAAPIAALQIVAICFVSAYLLSVGICLIYGLLSYKNAAIAIADNKVTISNGSIVKTTTVIRRKDLIGIEEITTPCRKKKNIYSFKIHFFTNAHTNTVTVKNLDSSVFESLEGILRY